VLRDLLGGTADVARERQLIRIRKSALGLANDSIPDRRRSVRAQ
jgi:hypothetical protein